MTYRLRRLAFVAVMAGALLWTGATPAGAADGDLVVTVDGGGPLFDADEVYPGYETVSNFRVRIAAGEAGTIGLRIINVVSDDNGCNRPEARVDTTCAPGEGELGDQMMLAVERYVAPGVFEPLSGPTTLTTLSAGIVLEENLAAGVEQRYRVTMSLPATSGNETQTDTVRFQAEVFGAAVISVGPSFGGGGALPPTDVDGGDPPPPDGDGDPPLDNELDPDDPATDVLGDSVTLVPRGGEVVAIQSNGGAAAGVLPRTGSEPAKLWLAGVALLLIGTTSTVLGREMRGYLIQR